MSISNLGKQLQARPHALGIFVLSRDPFVMEACATTALDWLAFDMEAGAVGKADLLHFAQACQGRRVLALARIADSRPESVEQALDLGLSGVIIPKVNNAEIASKAAMACRFQPQGNRGVNPVRASDYFENVATYFATANENTLCIAQIESAEAIANVDEIAAISQIDGLFIGCGDLAMSLNTPGQVDSPPMRDAIAKVLAACRRHGKLPGIFAYELDLARRYLAEGFHFVAVGNDIKAVKNSISNWLTQVQTVSAQ